MRIHAPYLEIVAAVGLLATLIWALLAALYVAFFGLTPADLAAQPEASITFPGARLERETAHDADLDILFTGLSPARFDRDYRTSAPFADVIAFYRAELESRGWSVLVGLHDFDACARGLNFSVRSQFTSATFAVEISQTYFRHPPECRQGIPPAPEAVALGSVVAFTIYIARASLLQRRARRLRGGPLRTAGGVARWGPAFAFVPYLILDWRPGPTIAPSQPIIEIGLALIVVGAAFAFWAASTLGTQFDLEPEVHQGHSVVRRGPYRFVRHPVYVGLAVHLVGACIASGNLVLILGVLLVGLPLLYLRARMEEQLLRAELGSSYEAYAHDVGMFFPRLTRRA